MSTHAIIAAEFDDGIRGVYVHNDGYPDVRVQQLADLLARDGFDTVRDTLCGTDRGDPGLEGAAADCSTSVSSGLLALGA